MSYKHLSVQKKTCTWLWTAVDHFKPGILGWVLGDHSAKTFEPLWEIVSKWNCYFYVTDGWKVYPNFIPEGDQIISKTYIAVFTKIRGRCWEESPLGLSGYISCQLYLIFLRKAI